MSIKKNITESCRYLDMNRRVYLPAHILDKANIPVGCMLDFEIENGCIVAKQVLGITVLDHIKKGALIKKGK